MKIREGFVSNSSSSSFVISLDDITGAQLKKIKAHKIKGAKMGIRYALTDPWTISVTDSEVKGQVGMDNFNMEEFLRNIGVDMHKVKWR